jgi:hypothetical protein
MGKNHTHPDVQIVLVEDRAMQDDFSSPDAWNITI